MTCAASAAVAAMAALLAEMEPIVAAAQEAAAAEDSGYGFSFTSPPCTPYSLFCSSVNGEPHVGGVIWTRLGCNAARALAGMLQAGQVCGPWQHHGQQQSAPGSAHSTCAEGYHPPLQVGRLTALSLSVSCAYQKDMA